MAGVWFYHLTSTPTEAALATLLEKTLEKGWRAIVRATTRERLAALDSHLWTYSDESFLPHGLADQPHAAAQPVLLTLGTDNLNRADVAFLIDQAEIAPSDAFQRISVLFQDRDADAVTAARALWAAKKAEGAALSYWRQDERGRFERKG